MRAAMQIRTRRMYFISILKKRRQMKMYTMEAM